MPNVIEKKKEKKYSPYLCHNWAGEGKPRWKVVTLSSVYFGTLPLVEIWNRAGVLRNILYALIMCPVVWHCLQIKIEEKKEEKLGWPC